MSAAPVSWVVGAGGLLGSAVVRELGRRGLPVLRSEVPWADPDATLRVLEEAAAGLVAREVPWRVLWCAGAGVVATSQADLDQEVAVVGAFLDRLAGLLDPAAAARGSFFLASSAGGVHAGSSAPPFTEATEPVPISPYGEAKLATERLAAGFAQRTGVPLLVGRIANLYGPGQDIGKAQGLISQLCKAHLTRTPISIYVSLDTARDYLFVDDCARMVLDGTELVARPDARAVLGADGPVLKLMATGRGTTIGSILAELRRVTKRRPQVVLAANPLARFQTRDLRFESRVLTGLDRHVSTTLAAGVQATLDALGRDQQDGHLVVRAG